MIRISNLTKSYGKPVSRKTSTEVNGRIHALRGATLAINEPGFFAIMGPSGSGKSTLLHLLAGLDRPDSGEIIVNGNAIHSMNEKDLTAYRRTQIGIVFQKFNLIPTMDALTNVMLPGLLDGQTTRKLHDRTMTLFEQVKLTDRIHHRPDALSGGEQQRIALARALLLEPKTLLADEPTGNLDSTSSEQIWRMLADLARTNAITVVMVTHEPAAAALCRDIFVLRDGRLTDEFNVEKNDAHWVADRYQQSQD